MEEEKPIAAGVLGAVTKLRCAAFLGGGQDGCARTFGDAACLIVATAINKNDFADETRFQSGHKACQTKRQIRFSVISWNDDGERGGQLE